MAAVRRWSKSGWLVLCEAGVVVLLFVLDIRHHIFISKNLYLFVVAWVSLRVRSLR